MYCFIIFSLLWLILGFISFLKEARDEKQMDFDNDTLIEMVLCFIIGPFAFIIIFFGESFKEIKEKRKKKKEKNLFVKFMEWLMKLVQKKEK